jgi:hypothetical protein
VDETRHEHVLTNLITNDEGAHDWLTRERAEALNSMLRSQHECVRWVETGEAAPCLTQET